MRMEGREAPWPLKARNEAQARGAMESPSNGGCEVRVCERKAEKERRGEGEGGGGGDKKKREEEGKSGRPCGERTREKDDERRGCAARACARRERGGGVNMGKAREEGREESGKHRRQKRQAASETKEWIGLKLNFPRFMRGA